MFVFVAVGKSKSKKMIIGISQQTKNFLATHPPNATAKPGVKAMEDGEVHRSENSASDSEHDSHLGELLAGKNLHMKF